ncbi:MULTISPECIES: EF-hand domain-containing protein [Alteromonas]|nr:MULTISPECIES: EF-hand domain-containing protein [Alteromonas]
MMKRREKVFLLLLTIAALQGIMVAEANATAAQRLMQQLDVNKDGVISLKEAVRHTELLRNFGLIDDNEDGKLTETELAKSKLTPGSTAPNKAGD